MAAHENDKLIAQQIRRLKPQPCPCKVEIEERMAGFMSPEVRLLPNYQCPQHFPETAKALKEVKPEIPPVIKQETR